MSPWVKRFYRSSVVIALWENTEKLSSFLEKVNEFDAIFYVGGMYWTAEGRC